MSEGPRPPEFWRLVRPGELWHLAGPPWRLVTVGGLSSFTAWAFPDLDALVALYPDAEIWVRTAAGRRSVGL